MRQDTCDGLLRLSPPGDLFGDGAGDEIESILTRRIQAHHINEWSLGLVRDLKLPDGCPYPTASLICPWRLSRLDRYQEVTHPFVIKREE
jgi:hypothetical protein